MRALLLLALFGCFTPAESADAGPPPRPPFCPQPGADLCADFEMGTDPGAGFTSVEMHGAAAGSIDRRSLLVTVPASATTASEYAPSFETTASNGESRITFAFRADVLPAVLTIASASYEGDRYVAQLQLAMGNLYLLEVRAGVVDTPFTVAKIDPTAWHAYELVVSPSRRKLDVSIDGSVSSFGMAASQSFTLAGKKTLSIGAVYADPTRPEASVHFDDVAFFH